MASALHNTMSRIEQSRVQSAIAVASFIVAAALAFWGMAAPPEGALTESNLYVIAQFLLVTCSICGVNSIILRTLGNHVFKSKGK